jgi:hypothetical protein
MPSKGGQIVPLLTHPFEAPGVLGRAPKESGAISIIKSRLLILKVCLKSAQVAARAVTQRMALREVLTSATAIGAEVAESLKSSELISVSPINSCVIATNGLESSAPRKVFQDSTS